MPRVKPLTERQRIAQRNQRYREAVRDGMAAVKNRESLSNKELAARFGTSHVTIAKILRAEEIMVSMDTLLVLLDAAGLCIKRKEAPL